MKLASKGIIAVFKDSLDRIDAPIFAFEPRFDVIITTNQVWALNQKAFESLFKDSEAVLAKTSEWVESLSGHLPIEGGSKVYLADRLKKNSVLRNKVLSVLRKPHISGLKTEDIEAAIERHSLSPQILNAYGQFVFDSSTERDILQLLNEDLFTGEFSGSAYAASKKATRSGDGGS